MRIKGLTVLMLVICFGAGLIAARWGGPRKQEYNSIRESMDDQIRLLKTPDEVGFLHVKAEANIPSTHLYERPCWWEVIIQQVQDDRTFREVHRVPYEHQLFKVTHPSKKHVTFDDKITMPPGRYWVQIAIHENVRRMLDFEGNAEEKPILLLTSAWQTVK
jgi:hypothetical protein